MIWVNSSKMIFESFLLPCPGIPWLETSVESTKVSAKQQTLSLRSGKAIKTPDYVVAYEEFLSAKTKSSERPIDRGHEGYRDPICEEIDIQLENQELRPSEQESNKDVINQSNEKNNDYTSRSPRRKRVLDDIPRQILVQSLSSEEQENPSLPVPVSPIPSIKKNRSQQLIDFQKRNQIIGIKRREEISKARLRYKPGTREPIPRNLHHRKHEDDYSISSFSSRSTSSSMSTSSRTSSSMSLLARKLKEIDKRSHCTLSTEVSTFSRTESNISIGSNRSRRLQELSERNRIIGLKRKNEIAKAREAAKPPSLRLPTVQSSLQESGRTKHTIYYEIDENSTPSRSFSSSSRLDMLYEKGKQKRRAALDNSMHKNQSSSRKINLTPSSRSKSNLADLRKRNLEIGIKRREDIAKARAASKPQVRNLPELDYNPNNKVSLRK